MGRRRSGEPRSRDAAESKIQLYKSPAPPQIDPGQGWLKDRPHPSGIHIEFPIQLHMDLSSYLLKSPSHKKFLELLVSGSEAYSKADLAKLSGLPYATTHAEVAKLEDLGLVERTNVGKQSGYRMEVPDDLRNALTLLFGLAVRERTESREASPTDEHVKQALQALGAPVVVAPQTPEASSALSKEETFARAALLAKTDPAVARALPVALHQHFESLDLNFLEVLAKKLHSKQEVGFFLELTSELSGLSRLKTESRKFRDRRIVETKSFFEESESKLMRALSERNTPDVARRWKFRMNMSFDTFKSTFDRFSVNA
ncbi:hypothetical protein BH10BDE1_BH10BDE1_13800 [soil metagenome]